MISFLDSPSQKYLSIFIIKAFFRGDMLASVIGLHGPSLLNSAAVVGGSIQGNRSN
jgi:hypothetical protein